MQNKFNGQTQQNFTRRSSLSDGYYHSIDDDLTLRRLVKGLAYASVYAALGFAALFIGSVAGF